MNQAIEVLKTTASSLSMPEARRNAALIQLREIAGNPSDSRASDAALVLKETLYGSVQPPVPTGKQKAAKSSDPSNPEHPDYYWFLFAEWKNRQEEFYRQARADGLTAAETVAKLRQGNPSPAAAATFGILTQKAEACRQGGEHAARTHHCPQIYRLLRETEARSPYDWPARELAEQILNEYRYTPSEKEKNTPIL